MSVGWIYLAHGTQLQAVKKNLAAVYCKTNCWLFKVAVGGGGATPDLEVTNGYGVLCRA